MALLLGLGLSLLASFPAYGAKPQNSARYAVGSRPDPAASGYSSSANVPRPWTESVGGEEGLLQLRAFPSVPSTLRKASAAIPIRVINRTGKEMAFPACDSLLQLVCEAKDKHGNWVALEKMPYSWCGNSYHKVFLPPRHYWELTGPHLGGSYRTRLRYRLMGEIELLSNEFEGGVQPGLLRSKG